MVQSAGKMNRNGHGSLYREVQPRTALHGPRSMKKQSLIQLNRDVEHQPLDHLKILQTSGITHNTFLPWGLGSTSAWRRSDRTPVQQECRCQRSPPTKYYSQPTSSLSGSTALSTKCWGCFGRMHCALCNKSEAQYCYSSFPASQCNSSLHSNGTQSALCPKRSLVLDYLLFDRVLDLSLDLLGHNCGNCHCRRKTGPDWLFQEERWSTALQRTWAGGSGVLSLHPSSQWSQPPLSQTPSPWRGWQQIARGKKWRG